MDQEDTQDEMESHPCCIHSSHLYYLKEEEDKERKKCVGEIDEEEKVLVFDYSLEEIEEGFKKFLDRPPEERAVQRDPFVYRDRDLHVNHCLRVIPDSFKEKIENALNDPKAIHSSQSVSNLRLLE